MQFKKVSLLIVFLLLCLLILCGSAPKLLQNQENSVKKLVVLHTNDSHGRPLKFYNHPVPDVGGLPARATLFNRIKSENENVLILDAGDINTGRAESNFFKAEPDILGYNYAGYDAMTLGNHEFDNPLNVLKWQSEIAKFPFLCANIKAKEGNFLMQPYVIKSYSGIKVAIFGLTTSETKYIGNPEVVRDLIFEDEIKVAEELVPMLRERADIIIALTHMGIYPSCERGSKRLASKVKGIDLIVDGHTHTRLDSPIVIEAQGSSHKTPIVQAWQWGLIVGKVDLFIKDKKIVDYKYEVIPVNLKKIEKKPSGEKMFHLIGDYIKEDKNLLALLKPYADKIELTMSEPIGYSMGTFLNKHVRERETALGDLIADSMLWHTRNFPADFAIQNGGAIRMDLPSGQINKKLIYEILPFDSTVVVISLKGSEVLRIFDHIATISDGEGAFPQVSEGVQFAINREKKICENIFINAEPIETDKIYRVATNSYLGNGGDGYGAFLNSTEKYDTSKFQRDVFADYIKHLGGIIRPKQRIRFSVIR